MGLRRRESFPLLLDNEPPYLVSLSLRPDDGNVSDRPVRDPSLRPVDQPSVSNSFGSSYHAGGIRAKIRLGQTKTTDDFSSGHLRQGFSLLLFAAERINRVHAQCALHGREAANPPIARFELLHHQSVRHVVHSGAPVLFGQVCSEHAQIGQLRDQMTRKAPFLIMLCDYRIDFSFDELSNRLHRESFFFRQKSLDTQHIYAIKSHEWFPPVRYLDRSSL